MDERTERAHQPDKGANLPSPEQIEAAAAEIRAGWSEAEFSKRAGVGYAPWSFPVVPAADFQRAAGRRDG
jgi:hypothetical protein